MQSILRPGSSFSAWILVSILALSLKAAFPQIQVPGNDDFAHAIELPTIPGQTVVAGSTTWATREPGEPYNSNGVASVRYKWSPAVSGYFRLIQHRSPSVWIFPGGTSVDELALKGKDGENPWLEAGGSADLNGAVVRPTALGNILIEAAQPGSADFDPAPSVQHEFSVLELPSLLMSRSADQLLLSWPERYTMMKLQSSSWVTGPWLDLSREGEASSIAVGITETQRYFRLVEGVRD